MKPVILCVDDEKIVLDSLKSQLKKEFGDFDLEIAESGEEALEIIEEFIGGNRSMRSIMQWGKGQIT